MERYTEDPHGPRFGPPRGAKAPCWRSTIERTVSSHLTMGGGLEVVIAALAFRVPAMHMSAATDCTAVQPAEVPLVQLLSTCIDASQHGCAAIRRVHATLERESDDELAVMNADYKIEGDPRSALTAADLASQRAVVDALERAWPGLRVVAEEDDAQASSSDGDVEDPAELRRDLCVDLEGRAPRVAPLGDITVFVDPLDGTREFVEGRVWNVQVLVGIAVHGEAVAGAVGLPFANGSSDSATAVVYGMVGAGPPQVRVG